MRWIVPCLLLCAAGCGYHDTRMEACPETGCHDQFSAQSPEGTVYTPPDVTPTPAEPMSSPAPVPPPVAPPPVTQP